MLLEAASQHALVGVPVEVWQTDNDGRYPGFQPIQAGPGEQITSASVPRVIVAPQESFLRGSQRTDNAEMVALQHALPGLTSEPDGASVLTEACQVEIVRIAVTGSDAAEHVRAPPADGDTVDVIDTMTFAARARGAHPGHGPNLVSDLAGSQQAAVSQVSVTARDP